MRLRSTARGAALRAIARPSRGWPRPLSGRHTAASGARVIRNPWAKACLKSAGWRMRTARCKAAPSCIAVNPGPPVPGSLRDQAGAALGAAAGQHQAAALGGHAGAETVGALAPQGVRLERAFHDTGTRADKRASFYRLVAAAGKIGAAVDAFCRISALWISASRRARLSVQKTNADGRAGHAERRPLGQVRGAPRGGTPGEGDRHLD